MRIDHIARGAPVTLRIDGTVVTSFVGETIATAMIAHGHATFRHDGFGMPRGLFCNMGSCGECMVTLDGSRRVRACLTDVRDGMEIGTDD